MLYNNDHIEIYHKLLYLLCEEFDEKRFCFVLHGVSNSGKTKIIERLVPLFHTFAYFENSGKIEEKWVVPEYDY